MEFNQKIQLQAGAQNAIEQLLMDGAEMRATRRVLSNWFEARGLDVPDMPYLNGDWTAQTTGGLPPTGFQEFPTWHSYHEMLADLLPLAATTPSVER